MLELTHNPFSHFLSDFIIEVHSHLLSGLLGQSFLILNNVCAWRLTRVATKILANANSWSSNIHTSRVLSSSNCSSKNVMMTFWSESSLGALLNQGVLQYNKKKLKKILSYIKLIYDYLNLKIFWEISCSMLKM